MAISIVTDSVACLPKPVADRYHISVVPMEIVHKGRVYRDSVDISPVEFYRILKDSDVLPTTSAPSPQTYLDTYERITAEGNRIIVICSSSRLTHAFASARIAADMLKEKLPGAAIDVLDSGTAAGAQGFVVMDAAEAAIRNGDNPGYVIRLVKDAMREVHVVVFFDTIEYLARGGRVPYILAWANSLLKIKPIVELLPLGKGVIPIGRARTRPRALERLIEILEGRALGSAVRVAVQHTDAIIEAQELAVRVKSRLNCGDIWIQDFTPVMGVHTGPGLVGLSYSTYKI
jgi:DegV family protein with EDD domain